LLVSDGLPVLIEDNLIHGGLWLPFSKLLSCIFVLSGDLLLLILNHLFVFCLFLFLFRRVSLHLDLSHVLLVIVNSIHAGLNERVSRPAQTDVLVQTTVVVAKILQLSLVLHDFLHARQLVLQERIHAVLLTIHELLLIFVDLESGRLCGGFDRLAHSLANLLKKEALAPKNALEAEASAAARKRTRVALRCRARRDGQRRGRERSRGCFPCGRQNLLNHLWRALRDLRRRDLPERFLKAHANFLKQVGVKHDVFLLDCDLGRGVDLRGQFGSARGGELHLLNVDLIDFVFHRLHLFRDCRFLGFYQLNLALGLADLLGNGRLNLLERVSHLCVDLRLGLAKRLDLFLHFGCLVLHRLVDNGVRLLHSLQVVELFYESLALDLYQQVDQLLLEQRVLTVLGVE